MESKATVVHVLISPSICHRIDRYIEKAQTGKLSRADVVREALCDFLGIVNPDFRNPQQDQAFNELAKPAAVPVVPVKENKSVSEDYCPKCGYRYKSRTSPTDKKICPHCGFSPAPPEPEQEDDDPELWNKKREE